jgi:hypothetical protein
MRSQITNTRLIAVLGFLLVTILGLNHGSAQAQELAGPREKEDRLIAEVGSAEICLGPAGLDFVGSLTL